MKEHALSENILICLAAAFIGAVWQYEMYFGEAVHQLMCYGAFLLNVIVWAMISFYEGRKKRTGFVIFTLLFYILPQIPIIYAKNSDFNAVADSIAKVSSLFTRSAFSAVLGNASIGCAAAACSLFLAVFILGELTADKNEKKPEDNAHTDI